jgi:hypothetical protein
MSAEFVYTETDQHVASSFAGTDLNGNKGACLEVFNLENALELRTLLELGFEVKTVEASSLVRDTNGVLTLDRFLELDAAGKVVVGRFCATVNAADAFRLALDSAPDGLEG